VEGIEALRRELGFARRRLGAAAAPKEITFAASLPTRSGKIMRCLLRAHERGLPEGSATRSMQPRTGASANRCP
jgi:acetyl-CoA synthetase